MEILSKTDGLMLIIGYFIAMVGIIAFLRKRENTKSEFLVADRSASWILTAFSMAATWVWAPSMFTAAEKAYTQGLAGVFWFVVPNVLTLVLFAFFAKKMRNLRPNGWTFSDYIREKYSNRAHNMFLIESFGLQICSMAVQLLAGAAIFHKITGLPFFLTTVLLAVIPLLYSLTNGIRGSITTTVERCVVVLLMGLPIMDLKRRIRCTRERTGRHQRRFRKPVRQERHRGDALFRHTYHYRIAFGYVWRPDVLATRLLRETRQGKAHHDNRSRYLCHRAHFLGHLWLFRVGSRFGYSGTRSLSM